MRQVRPIEASEIDIVQRILRDAFAGVPFPAVEPHREALLEQLEVEDNTVYGVYDDEQMVGTLRVHDFVMNVFGIQIPVKGLGGVAVGLCDKKNKVARDLVEWFHAHSHTAGCAMTSLYPFRASFYAKMGYGTGTPLHRYHLLPDSLPELRNAPAVRFLGPDDLALICECYERVQRETHGMFGMDGRVVTAIKKPDSSARFVGVEIEGKLEAYMVFGFSELGTENPLRPKLDIFRWIYTTTRGLHGLLAFLRKQGDQVDRISLMTQDRHLHHLFEDPVDGSENFFHISHQVNERALGVMYRLLDPERMFEQLQAHSFGGVDLDLRVALTDDFWERTSRPFRLRIEAGRARVVKDKGSPEAELRIGVGDFSSLVLGVLGLGRLLDYGRAHLDVDETRAHVERAFLTPEPPICHTGF
ncbi:MAG: putative acetyltransferase [Planctomycetota bacterium]|jgi:predicted acetyltransferase